MNKYLVLTTLAATTLFSACSKQEEKAQTPAPAADQQAAETLKLTVGTEAGYAPFEYLDENGNIVGFDIDIMNYVCTKIGATCEVVNQSFDGLIPSVKAKKLDFAIAAFDVTPERQKQVAFSTEYLPKPTVLYVVNKESDFNSISDIKTVGYQNGTPFGKYLETKTPEVKTVPYDSYSLALLDLKSKRLDAVMANTEVANEFIKDESYKVFGEPISDEILGSGMAIVLNQENTELLDKINAAINEALNDGTIAALKDKYGLK